jgi:hypothetical protein
VKGVIKSARIIIPRLCVSGGFLGLLLSCSCATENPAHPRLPGAVTMNQDAGRSGPLILTVRLRDGEQLPLVVDTGTSGTVLDKSLEPQLGKLLGQVTIQSWGKHEKKNLYAAPKLYLDSVPLMTGSNILTSDFKPLSHDAGRTVMGILGLDVLEHYCVQLDFTAGQIRFLDDEHADKEKWGQAFPMVALNSKDPRPAVAENLLGAQGPHSLIDSGYLADGWLMPRFYRQWTNQAVPPPTREARSPNGRFGGETYRDVSLDENNVESDGIGLRFLARHLVTLDFPNRMMYLKRTSDWPLANRELEAAVKPTAHSASDFLKRLKEKGQLPGWSKDDGGGTAYFYFHHSPHLDSVTVEAQKKGDPSIYHYTCTRASKGSPWKLQKAWRTDPNGGTIQKYPVP